MKKLFSLLSILTITGTSFPATIAASNYEKNNFNKNLNRKTRADNPPLTQRKLLSSLITNTELGELTNTDNNTILNRIRELNPNINIENIEIEQIVNRDGLNYLARINSRPNS
ncbi:hypothetical protein D6D54_07925 [Spiroplasma poulsonii]|uniref:Uncharacterized protein n=1 Tax=Spiroplasma poulsonii TaxID=2138 RepID=A0A433EN84_9MOLU|nr:hypothetical protein [Spiroplasma poulsonii]MBW3058889.1 hypothetical protein [Spiroplasma poulsonii]RUP75753.1 hypothetical protein D6D54_07925 [Spiroplasma poulsonii]